MTYISTPFGNLTEEKYAELKAANFVLHAEPGKKCGECVEWLKHHDQTCHVFILGTSSTSGCDLNKPRPPKPPIEQTVSEKPELGPLRVCTSCMREFFKVDILDYWGDLRCPECLGLTIPIDSPKGRTLRNIGRFINNDEYGETRLNLTSKRGR